MNTLPRDTSNWNKAKPDVIPRPTSWPAVMAFGIMFIFWGIITSWTIIAVGAAVFVVSLAGWIKEIIHEHS